MRKSIGVITSVAFTIAAVAAWSNASIRADAALKTFGPMVTDAQIDVFELTKTRAVFPLKITPPSDTETRADLTVRAVAPLNGNQCPL